MPRLGSTRTIAVSVRRWASEISPAFWRCLHASGRRLRATYSHVGLSQPRRHRRLRQTDDIDAGFKSRAEQGRPAYLSLDK